MTIRRSPSAMGLSSGGTRSLLSRDASKHRSDGHAETGEIPFANDVSCHDFASRKNIRRRTEPLHLRQFIHLHTEISKRDSRPQWISVERRTVDSLGPVRFRWNQSFGAAVI